MKIIIEKQEKVIPTKKGTCPECQIKMHKKKNGDWLCLKCGLTISKR
jgi:ribosomal protein S27AE